MFVRHTRRFALRAVFAARYTCSGRANIIQYLTWTEVRDQFYVHVSDLKTNAKSSAAMLQEDNPDTTHEYTVCTWYIAVVLAILLSVSGVYNSGAFFCLDELAPTLGMLGVDGWKAHISWNMWFKRRPSLVMSHIFIYFRL